MLYQLSYTGPGCPTKVSPKAPQGVKDARNIVGGPGFGKPDSGGGLGPLAGAFGLIRPGLRILRAG